MDKKSLGYTYALIALIFLIVWPIFSKIGFGYFNYQTTAVLWFGTAALFSFLMLLFSGRLREYKTFRTHWKYIILLGMINAGSVLTGWYALDIIGPSLFSFIVKINIITMVLSGTVFLKEKFNLYEAISGFVTIMGVVLITFSKGEYLLLGVIMIILHSVFYTLANLLIKSKFKSIKPLMIVNYRAIGITLFCLIFTLIFGKLNIYLSKGLLFATLPAIFSAVLAHIFIYRAYKIIEMSKTELIISAQPFFVLVLAFFVFGEVLSLMQWLGGILIVGGVIGLIYGRKMLDNNKKADSVKDAGS